MNRGERYRPPYSLDTNPIEKAYSKLKAFLRKHAGRTVSGVKIPVDACADTFKPAAYANDFATTIRFVAVTIDDIRRS